MTRCVTRRVLYRKTLIRSWAGSTKRYNFIYYLRSIFFLSFFWRYFHRRLRPNAELGRVWPPFGISVFNPFGVPLLNRIILLSSGASVTWSHHAIIIGNHSQANRSLILTVVLGLYFRVLQGYEYFEARFNISDRAYGSTFYIATGFHGLHVIVGTLFLLASNIRLLRGKLRHRHHFGFEASAWYWHFVDVVWLFLYVRVYAWSGLNFLVLKTIY